MSAVEKLPASVIPDDRNPARSLLDQAEELELRYLEKMNPDMKPGTLQCVSWDEVGTRVTIPAWRKFTAEYSSALEGVTAESLPAQIPKLRQIGSGIRDPKGMLLDPEQRTRRAGLLFGAGLSLALVDQGWTLHSGPGVFHLQKGTEQLNPFLVIEQLMSGKLTVPDWMTQCSALGIGRVRLGPEVAVQLSLLEPPQ